ncbi:uncharacterized protein EI97DRAFT_438197 [Westerdykella ornata]|uniref:Uncharacterized protein n=1 Tax=Westerdykella ornata TaxID=318751 RepID=A0A6A6JWF9_WESOR|nr:uncharacterized protein EI97DRAFT_438197 [Westerdykella ornata]KAF2280747.1 hypothetical protein EI97DRAFT_438197 [Westerdykella ornata]
MSPYNVKPVPTSLGLTAFPDILHHLTVPSSSLGVRLLRRFCSHIKSTSTYQSHNRRLRSPHRHIRSYTRPAAQPHLGASEQILQSQTVTSSIVHPRPHSILAALAPFHTSFSSSDSPRTLLVLVFLSNTGTKDGLRDTRPPVLSTENAFAKIRSSLISLNINIERSHVAPHHIIPQAEKRYANFAALSGHTAVLAEPSRGKRDSKNAHGMIVYMCESSVSPGIYLRLLKTAPCRYFVICSYASQ